MTMFGRNRKGFSLIEIGIVMVVIGIIIAAVMKGKDVINSAETKQFSQDFMGKWLNVVDGYYDKTGINLGATPDAPKIATGTLITCNETTTLTALNNAGIDAERIIKSGLSTATNLVICTDETAGQFLSAVSTVEANTGRLSVETNNLPGVDANVLQFTGVPADIAVAFDTLIDGKADALSGRVIRNTGGTQWADAGAASTQTVTVILEH